MSDKQTKESQEAKKNSNNEDVSTRPNTEQDQKVSEENFYSVASSAHSFRSAQSESDINITRYNSIQTATDSYVSVDMVTDDNDDDDVDEDDSDGADDNVGILSDDADETIVSPAESASMTPEDDSQNQKSILPKLTKPVSPSPSETTLTAGDRRRLGHIDSFIINVERKKSFQTDSRSASTIEGTKSVTSVKNKSESLEPRKSDSGLSAATLLSKRVIVLNERPSIIQPEPVSRSRKKVHLNVDADEELNDSSELESDDEDTKFVHFTKNDDDKEQPQRSSKPSIRKQSQSDHELRQELKRGLPSITSILQTNLQLGNAFIYMVVPPDGGYGWLILVISFLVQVIVDGIIFSVGILLPYMAKDLNVSRRDITLVASMQIGFYFLFGAVASALINKYGFRPVALVGVVVSITCLLLATLSPNLPVLILLYSIMAGPALSFLWVSSQLIIGYYFEKYRPIANGISCSGAGAGILVFCILNSAIIDDLGWRNTTRVHAAILILALFMTLTFIEVRPTRIGHIVEPDDDTDSDEDTQDLVDTYRFSRQASQHQLQIQMEKGIDQMLVEYERPPPPEPNSCVICLVKCCPQLSSCLGIDNRVSMPTDFQAKRYLIQHDPLEKQDLFYTGPVHYESGDDDSTIDLVDGKHMHVHERNKRNTIGYRLSMMHAARTQSQKLTFKEMKDTTRFPFLSFLSPTNWLPDKVLNGFRTLFDFNLLQIMEFKILVASAFFFTMGFNIPFVYSKERVEITPFYASLIAPVIGFSNFMFRIISGFVANKYKAQTTYICGSGIVFGGCIVFVSAFYGLDIVWFQFLYGFCYGIAPAFYSTLRAIIYVRALGLSKLTNAFGLTALAMGFGVFVGTTLAGILNDLTGSYQASFILAGTCLLTSGSLKLMLPTLMKWRQNRLSKLSNDLKS